MLTNLKNAADRALAKVANRFRGATAITDSAFNSLTPPAVLIETNDESDYDYVLTLLVTQDSEHLLLAPISDGDAEERHSPVTRLLLMPRDFVLDEHFFESAEAALTSLKRAGKRTDDYGLEDAVIEWCSDDELAMSKYGDIDVYQATSAQPLAVNHLGCCVNPFFSVERLRQSFTDSEDRTMDSPGDFVHSILQG